MIFFFSGLYFSLDIQTFFEVKIIFETVSYTTLLM